VFATSGFPAIVNVSKSNHTLLEWATDHAQSIEDTLSRVGAILFKTTSIENPEMVEEFARITSSEIPTFTEESSPRSLVKGKVLTSTDYPSEYPIQLHNEYSYAGSWPMKLFFCCLHPPAVGGETPIADSRAVLSRMRPSTRNAFEKKGILYLRNYRPNIGVSWQTAFSTDDSVSVGKICDQAKIEYAWDNNGVLRTRQFGSAIVSHPKTNELTWFNHAFFFNVRAIEPVALRDVLTTYPDNDPLSTNTLFGDGSPIGPEIIEEIRALYAGASSYNRWEPGDVLLIDNMLTAHGRSPYKGRRQIVVVMADRVVRSQLSPLPQ
jgi:Taurine catabolism dioxygenase TauD, TfdA family